MKRRLYEISAVSVITGTALATVIGCGSNTHAEHSSVIPGNSYPSISMPNPDTGRPTESYDLSSPSEKFIDAINKYSLQHDVDNFEANASRCVFAAGQVAISELLNYPGVTKQSESKNITKYSVTVNNPDADQMHMTVDTNGNSVKVDYYAWHEAKYGSHSTQTSGEIIFNRNGSVESAVNGTNPLALNDQYSIKADSGVTNLDSLLGNQGGEISSVNSTGSASDVCSASSFFLDGWYQRIYDASHNKA